MIIPYVTAVSKDGTPDYLQLDGGKVQECADKRLCGVCGQPLGSALVFVGGELSLKARQFSDPPMHPQCADSALRECPWLNGSRPRRETGVGQTIPASRSEASLTGFLEATGYTFKCGTFYAK